MRTSIRIKLYERGLLLGTHERPGAISKKCQVANEEIVRLDDEAKAERKRQQQKLDNARPTDERCKQKACPYRSVLDGNCRQHATDKILERSVLPSQLGAAAGFR